MAVTQVIKENGETQAFDKKKIANAIFAAAQKVGGADKKLADSIADEITREINKRFTEDNPPKTSDINKIVEYELMRGGHVSTLKAYINYRFENL